MMYKICGRELGKDLCEHFGRQSVHGDCLSTLGAWLLAAGQASDQGRCASVHFADSTAIKFQMSNGESWLGALRAPPKPVAVLPRFIRVKRSSSDAQLPPLLCDVGDEPVFYGRLDDVPDSRDRPAPFPSNSHLVENLLLDLKVGIRRV